MNEFTLNIPEFTWIAETFLENYTDDIKDNIQENTPEKTWSLVESIKKSTIVNSWNWFTQDVYIDDSDLDYDPNLVEDWVSNRTFNYHKPEWVVKWQGNWRHMVRDTFLAFQKTTWQNKI